MTQSDAKMLNSDPQLRHKCHISREPRMDGKHRRWLRQPAQPSSGSMIGAETCSSPGPPMVFPATTAFFAALFGLYFVALSAWIVGSRVSTNTLIGDGGHKALQTRVRCHGNFAEYVPFALLLIALAEASGSGQTFVHILLIVLLVARLLHPVGMFAPVNSPRQFACRGGGIVATFLVIFVASGTLLVRFA
jgi:uncharacterized membrane protein YecN with MAPEG domain